MKKRKLNDSSDEVNLAMAIRDMKPRTIRDAVLCALDRLLQRLEYLGASEEAKDFLCEPLYDLENEVSSLTSDKTVNPEKMN